MKLLNVRSTFVGSAIAFLLGTSCCWLPFLAISFGGAATLMSVNNTLVTYSPLFTAIGVGLLGVGAYRVYTTRSNSMGAQEIITHSVLTCPECAHQHEELMPTNACQYFYECNNCEKLLQPNPGDCCVYCSYGSVACPPIQANESCC